MYFQSYFNGACIHLLSTTLVVQEEQLSGVCVCVSVCPDYNFRTKWHGYIAHWFILTQYVSQILRKYSIIESRFRFTMKPTSFGFNVFLTVNNEFRGKQTTVTSQEWFHRIQNLFQIRKSNELFSDSEASFSISIVLSTQRSCELISKNWGINLC